MPFDMNLASDENHRNFDAVRDVETVFENGQKTTEIHTWTADLKKTAEANG